VIRRWSFLIEKAGDMPAFFMEAKVFFRSLFEDPGLEFRLQAAER